MAPYFLLDVFLTFEGELIEISKGNVGYPWQGTLAVVPHIALYNHYIIHVQTPRGPSQFLLEKISQVGFGACPEILLAGGF